MVGLLRSNISSSSSTVLFSYLTEVTETLSSDFLELKTIKTLEEVFESVRNKTLFAAAAPAVPKLQHRNVPTK